VGESGLFWNTNFRKSEAWQLVMVAVAAVREVAVGGDGSAINGNNIFFCGMRMVGSVCFGYF
jgi:hypothetical protein